MLMRWKPWLFLFFMAKLCCYSGDAAEFIVADGAYPGKATPPMGGNALADESMVAGSKSLSWRLVRSKAENGGLGASAILHTVEFERSDPRLAGLMLRCEKQGIEAIIVVVEPFPPRARPQITLRTPGQVFRFVGSIIPTGAGIRLPAEAADLVTGPWQKARELEINVSEGDKAFGGVVVLSGLSSALELLNAECVQK